METTRHFVTAVYVVEGDAVALHDHKRLDMWLPAGGHIDRDEVPHESAVREVKEEMGLDVELVRRTADEHGSSFAEPIPSPEHVMLEDINIHENGDVGHQHIDLVYYALAESRDISPEGDDEMSADAWEWFTKEELAAKGDDERFEADTLSLAAEAIDVVQSHD